jgi:ribosome-associated protein
VGKLVAWCYDCQLKTVSMNRKIDSAVLGRELLVTTSRSSGPGGQNVNKVNSKITLKFDIAQSQMLTPEEKETLLIKLAGKLTTEGVLIVTSQDKRSQLENKEAAIAKLERIINKAFEKKKKRKATKPTKSSVQERIKSKKQKSEKKQWRQKSDF